MKVELICFLYNKKMVDDLGISMPDSEAKITVDLKSLESIRERIADGEDEICKKTCMIYFKSGDSFLIKRNYNDMVELWGNL